MSPAGSTDRRRPVQGDPGRVRRCQVRGQDRGRGPRRPRRPAVGPVRRSPRSTRPRSSTRPTPPFKTSTLQQQAAIRLRFSGKKTMKVAQELYEGIDVDGSGPGRPDHLHANRQPAGLRRGDDRRPRQDQERVRRALPARQADPLRRRQDGPGGPRGHPPHRPGLHAGTDQGAR